MAQLGMGVAAAISSVNGSFTFYFKCILANKKFDINVIIKSPSFYAILVVVGILYFEIQTPTFVLNTVMLLAYGMIVLILISLGIALTQLKVFSFKSSINFFNWKTDYRSYYWCYFNKIFDLSGFAAGVLLIQCSMPSAILTYLIASMYSPKKIVDNIASMIVVSTLMSLVTVPIIVFIALKYFS